MARKIGKTIRPRNLAALEAHKPQYKSQIVPPKKGKKAQYSRKKKHSNNNTWSASFFKVA